MRHWKESAEARPCVAPGCAETGLPQGYCNRHTLLFSRYGLTGEDFNRMLAVQGGRCAICALAAPLLHVDHNHATGAVRALLCRECNVGLGKFRDDPVLLRSAAAYLERCAHAAGG
jgi:hypothetical protein